MASLLLKNGNQTLALLGYKIFGQYIENYLCIG